MKSGNLNFLEPSGPVQACNGTDLPLPLPSGLKYTLKYKMQIKLCDFIYSVSCGCLLGVITLLVVDVGGDFNVVRCQMVQSTYSVQPNGGTGSV